MAVKISDLLVKPIAIPVGGGNELMVKPLSMDAIVSVIKDYREPILQLIATAQQGKPDFAAALTMAPNMVASIIAFAADAQGQEEDVKQLPGPVQIHAMAEIWKASVPDVKKLIDSLSGVMGQAKKAPRPAPATVGEASTTS
jgi:hypothetical protein